MSRIPYPAAALLASLAVAAWAFDDPKPADPAPVKGRLPLHWKALSLTPDQTAAVEKVTGAAAAKVRDLEDQIAAVRTKEHADCLAVLSTDQKAMLEKLAAGEPAAPPPAPPPVPVKDK